MLLRRMSNFVRLVVTRVRGDTFCCVDGAFLGIIIGIADFFTMLNKRQQQVTGISVLDKPVSSRERAAYVHEMFDSIAPRYDLINTILSLGIHHTWRNFATRCVALQPGDRVLDVCTGTGDWAAVLKRQVTAEGTVVGVDFSLPMLQSSSVWISEGRVFCAQGDATRLPFADGVFDAATVAFGIRNIPETAAAFQEMARVVKPHGRIVCLEFADPPPGIFRFLYQFYSRWLLPNIGGAISGRREAYAYLPASVTRFHSRSALAQLMAEAGLTEVRWVNLTFGVVCVHVGIKRERQGDF
jgi:demethylmenaquinone methyltransferase/2-methoxy-6-polyprenyl-1,4-benzoquinol methylase